MKEPGPTHLPPWPGPKQASIPVAVERGRTWDAVTGPGLADLVGWLFANTVAIGIRLHLSVGVSGYRVRVLGASGPPVPYATLSGDHLAKFAGHAGQPEITVWVHREGFFWVDGLQDEDLEAMIDAYLSCTPGTGAPTIG